MSTTNECPSCHGRKYHVIDALHYACLYCRGTGEDPGPRHVRGLFTGQSEIAPSPIAELPPAFREPPIVADCTEI